MVEYDDGEMFETIRDDVEADYLHGQEVRERAYQDRIFARVTQWGEELSQATALRFQGQFDMLRRASRDIKASLTSNQVQITFRPKQEYRDDAAELMNGYYLSTLADTASHDAFSFAKDETIDCGIGGWEIYTDYESSRDGSTNQVIKRRPIPEFNSVVFFDAAAILLDKSDARRATYLEQHTEKSYKEAVAALLGIDVDEVDCVPSNIASPTRSRTNTGFMWIGEDKSITLAKHYRKSKIKDKLLTYVDALGNVLKLLESTVKNKDKDVYIDDELAEQGYELVHTRKIERYQVTCYYVCGEGIIHEQVINGDMIPLVPYYGERAIINGQEWYEGIVRLAKDPAKLRNIMLSYIATIAGSGQVEKPMFGAEQIQGHQHMYEQAGPENQYAYAVQNLKGANGEQLPLGPVGVIPAATIPPAVANLLPLASEAIEYVASPGLPKDLADTDLSGEAISLIQNRLDAQSQIYQENFKHALRCDARIFAGMAPEILDSPRQIMVTLPDGTRKTEQIMSSVVDSETGETVIANDLTNIEWDVYSDIGPAYSSRREKTFSILSEMAASVANSDPVLQKILILKQTGLIDGIDTDDIREYANKQLIALKVKEPQTEEEIAYAQELANQPKEPDANMVLAMAEQKKGEAELQKAQNAKAQLQLDLAKAQQTAKQFEAELHVKVAEKQKTIEKMQAEIDKMQAEMQLKFEQLSLDRDRLNFEKNDSHEKNVISLHSAQSKAKQARYDATQRRFVAQ